MDNSINSQKKWKYLSFALMGILATGIFSTQAFGASPTLTDIFNKLTGVDAKVTGIKASTDANLDAKVSTRATPADVTAAQSAINSHTDSTIAGQVKSKFLSLGIPTPAGQTRTSQIIEGTNGKTIGGHIVAKVIVAPEMTGRLICIQSNAGGAFRTTLWEGTDPECS
jgi:hypothetical protein